MSEGVYSNPELCPPFAPFFGFAGGAAAMVFSGKHTPMPTDTNPQTTKKKKTHHVAVGAACGTAMSGVSIAGIGTFRPDLVMKALIPVVMAGALRFVFFLCWL